MRRQACVAGTRIRVWDIHVWHHLRGQSPEQIIADFPQLTLSDVYAALAYYLDHREEIQRQMKEAEEFVAEIKRKQGVTKFDRLKQRLGLDDAVSAEQLGRRL